MAKKKTAATVGSWIVQMEVTKVIEIVCSNCTEEQARNQPWEHVDGDETEIEQVGWEVRFVEPNQ